MLDDAAIGGLNFIALHPAVSVGGPFDEDILVAHDARAFDADGFGNLNDGIGFTERPGGGKLARERGIVGVTCGAAAVEPVEEPFAVGGGQ